LKIDIQEKSQGRFQWFFVFGGWPQN